MISDHEFSTPERLTGSVGTMDKPLSVGDLTDLIKNQLERNFAEVVIVGEISNFRPHSSGHFYFSLKDERASISAVMFRGSNSHLKFQMQDGIKVIAIGRMSVYPPRGNYQIVLTRMEPAGLGALQLAFEQLKKKLEAEGFFRPERKRPIPRFPQTVGIVTASTGAAIRDMLNVLSRRFAGIKVQIFPVKVQGVGAGNEIADSIRWMNAYFPEIDVMIVGRGGGSIEDLWAFNEEVVARAIYDSKIPVISAVGHEIDFTIADFVADLRAPTPSAAAELVIGNKIELLKHLENLIHRLSQIIHRLDYVRMQVDDLEQRLQHAMEQRISGLQLKIERLRARVNESSPFIRLQQMRSRFDQLKSSLQNLWIQNFQQKKFVLEGLQQQLRLLNPLTIMERGYSIVRSEKSGKVIKKASDVQLGEPLLIQLWKGTIRSKV